MKLYLGCAMPPFHNQHHAVMGDVNEWTWVDLYIDHPNVKKWDATNLQEVPDGSCEAIYASHLLEHIPHIQTQDTLLHWYNKLQSGGQLTLNVPDLLWALQRLKDIEEGKTVTGYYNRMQGEHGVLSILYGSQSHEGEYHKAGFTLSSFHELLVSAGFKDISIKKFFDAHDMGVLFAEAYK